jgi:hypothetical protein
VQTFRVFDSSTILVQSNDDKLWLEHAPFGTVPPVRQQVDGNVRP